MIGRIDRLLQRWAEVYRLSGADLAGLGYPSGQAAVVLANPSRGRRRVDGRAAGVLRAGLSGGVSAHGVATRPGKMARRVIMPADLERLDKFISAELSPRARRLLDVVYVDNYHTAAEKAGMMGISERALYKRLDALHHELDAFLNPRSAVRNVDAELAAVYERVCG